MRTPRPAAVVASLLVAGAVAGPARPAVVWYAHRVDVGMARTAHDLGRLAASVPHRQSAAPAPAPHGDDVLLPSTAVRFGYVHELPLVRMAAARTVGVAA